MRRTGNGVRGQTRLSGARSAIAPARRSGTSDEQRPNGMKSAYDEHFVLDNKLMLEWYPHRVVGMAEGSSLLDLGLGHGYSTEYFAKHFLRYKVIECSGEIIQRFRDRFGISKVDIAQGYFEDFDTDESFDNIGMGFILEHVDDPAAILCRYRQF